MRRRAGLAGRQQDVDGGDLDLPQGGDPGLSFAARQ